MQRLHGSPASLRCGIAGAVPILVTESAPTALPKRAASKMSLPSASAVTNPPLNASPAPVVSIALTGMDGIISLRSGVITNTPCLPIVTTTFFTPLFIKICAAFSASSEVSTLVSVRMPASISFGVTMSSFFSSDSGSLRAGAVFSTICLPFACA